MTARPKVRRPKSPNFNHTPETDQIIRDGYEKDLSLNEIARMIGVKVAPQAPRHMRQGIVLYRARLLGLTSKARAARLSSKRLAKQHEDPAFKEIMKETFQREKMPQKGAEALKKWDKSGRARKKEFYKAHKKGNKTGRPPKWCPPDMLPLYWHLRKEMQMTPSEAKSAILEEIGLTS